MRRHEVDVCIAGGGPAGMITALLLAKAGVRTLVLEQHPDFEREYRGEVLMPRFTQMMRQIGLQDYLTAFPHIKLSGIEGYYRNRPFFRIGIDQIAPEAPFAVWMPQPVLLRALYEKARTFPSFDLWFSGRLKDVIEENGGAAGAIVEHGHEPVEVRCKILVGADGRFSVARRTVKGFDLAHESHKFDLVWFTVPQPPGYDQQVRFYLSAGRNYLILPKYPDQLQVGVVIAPGEFAAFRRQGIESFRKILKQTGQPFIEQFAGALTDFQPFSLLQAKIERVERWARSGMVLIGDAAHTCSPAGAIGVSVAAATAIVAADVIRGCILKADYSAQALGRIQELREKDVRAIQQMQEGFTRLLFPGSQPIVNALMPFVFYALAKLGLLGRFQRRLMVMESPLPVSQGLGF